MHYCIKYFEEIAGLQRNCKALCRGEEITIAAMFDTWVLEAHRVANSKGNVFFAGNGASATMAEHFGFDAMQNAGLKTINFSETAYLTAISNDSRFEEVFVPKLRRFGNPGDMLVTISSSGNSPNILRALEEAEKLGIFRVTLSAMRPDNHSRRMSELSIYVPASTYGLAESLHSALLHCWLDMYLENYMGGRH
jgi:D-sedoheptulose 7-phosphate isomerase